MNKVLFPVLFVLMLLSHPIFGQEPVGFWRTHYSYKNANQVVFTDQMVFVEANHKLYTYHPATNDVQILTNLDGLNGNDVSKIAWCSEQKTLVIIYIDGNIDFYQNGTIYNLNDFKKKSLTTDKSILNLRIYGSQAFISTKSGLLEVDVKRKEFSNAYLFSFNSGENALSDAVMYHDTLYMLTPGGIFAGNKNDNLLDADYWKQVDTFTSKNAHQLIWFNESFMLLDHSGNVFRGEPGHWNPFLTGNNILSIQSQDSMLFANSQQSTYIFDKAYIMKPIDLGVSNAVAYDSKNNLIYRAQGNQGLSELRWNGVRYEVKADSIFPEGPPMNHAWNSYYKDGHLYVTGGGRWTGRSWYPGEVAKFDGENWTDLSDIQSATDSIGYKPCDFLNIAVDPQDDSHYFITTWGDGLLEYKKNKFYKQYNQFNSPLKTIVPGRYCRVDGAIFDQNGDLWVLNSTYYSGSFKADSALFILNKNGTWSKKLFSQLKASPTWNSILFTRNNQVWLNSARVLNGIFVFDNTTTSNPSAKFYDSFTDQDGQAFSPWKILCMTEDLDGTVWIGTNLGPLVASNIEQIFDPEYTFTRIKIPRNDGSEVADYLLNKIQINCITVDGANRKWIGTENDGVYLVSADGTKTIHHFNTENSVLPSDLIWSISIHPETGEVFIGTEMGLVGFRSDAITGKEDYNRVYVFPNPVQPNFVGQITVTGLMKDTQVRITDLNGQTVIKGKSLGGQFSWNGYLVNGKKAPSGVYLVFVASADGMESQVSKFMIVR